MRPYLIALALVAVALPLPALADNYTYTYTGKDFTTAQTPFTPADFVSGQFTVAAPIIAVAAPGTSGPSSLTSIKPLSFSFTDGVQTITNSSPYVQDNFDFETNSAGTITGWYVDMQSEQSEQQDLFYNLISTENITGAQADDDFTFGAAQTAYNENAPGTWTITDNPSIAPVPEPSTIALASTGVAACITTLRRRIERRVTTD